MTRWLLPLAFLAASACSGEDPVENCLGQPVSVADLDGSVVLNWDAPRTRTDGSPIDDLSGYKIYYGLAPDQLRCQIEIRNPKATNGNVTALSPGTWYFAVVSVDSAKVESEPSGVVSKQID